MVWDIISVVETPQLCTCISMWSYSIITNNNINLSAGRETQRYINIVSYYTTCVCVTV